MGIVPMKGWPWYGVRDYQVIPYMASAPVYVDGMMSHLYYKTKEQGLIEKTFCGEAKNHDQFCFFFESLKTMQVCCEVTAENKLVPVGYTWVSNPKGADGARNAQCGMCFFSGAGKRVSARGLARLALAYAMIDLRINVLHGIQVVDNIPARNFALRLGFREIGIMPKFHYIDGRLEDARVLMLVDEGKIALDDPVEKYLPEFRGQMVVAEKDNDHTLLRKPAHPITVREVLSHMSGLPFKSAIEEPTLDGLPLAAAVRSYAMSPLQTEPGTHYSYANAGINTAARILEVVSGMKYEDFMQQRLFDPLGMKDTTFWPNAAQVRRLAKSYHPDDAKTNLVEFPVTQLHYPLTDRTQRFAMPAGGLFSTAQDTARFCQMLLNGGALNGRRYLSDAAFHELTKRQTPLTVNDSYGFGLAIGADWFGHGGAYSTNMEIRFQKGLVFIWMVQHGGFPGEGAKAQEVFKHWALERFGK